MLDNAQWGCGHVKYDPEIHDARWGARLIYSEVAAGSSGVVYNRQAPQGEKELVESLFPVVDRALDEFRKVKYELDSSQSGHLVWRENQRVVVLSPQGSYGYLYITALLEKVGHEGETPIWEFEDQPERKEFGNWPPRVVEAREAKQRKADEGMLEYLLRDYKWALDEVRYAKSDRARTIRQKKADKIGEEIEALRAKVGYPEEAASAASK